MVLNRQPGSVLVGRRVFGLCGVALIALALGACGATTYGAQTISSASTPPTQLSASVTAASASATLVSATPTLTPSATPTANYPVSQLTALIKQYIGMYGGSDIVSAQSVYTNRAAALSLATPGDDAGDDPNLPVYLLQADGTFTGGGMEPVPAGATQTPGTELMLVLDARTLSLLDLGLNPTRSDIGSLGSVVPLSTS